ncbi:hypothetical protein B2G88_09720 [Natronolimnobius baerhuensis]|uniref:Uncharacterized protein n=2 Tax=Natronolimnobius baerhuensis TaxID=253108 RepID=A0A202E8W9_9EURY|nr:hypothetical protein [Natronolimnobius baerhuensis]OVE84659.1 hypothetical protein B2G88_09720 [Natronolimnobius baerhuensis]
MNMASSELSAGTPLGRSLTVERVDTAPTAAPIRHVDELNPETFEAFYELVTADVPLQAGESGLEPGEIIVFTDYFRVEAR